MRKPTSVDALQNLGRIRLSKSFYMRDFLHSEIAEFHGIANVPDDPDLAVQAGRQLCEQLLEPLQAHFGRIAIRSAYRAPAVNEIGNTKYKSCASNEKNRAAHIWDQRDADGCMGATACIVVPLFWDRFQGKGDWRRLAWWIHDHLPYGSMYFYPKYFAFNLQWHEQPTRSISSYADPVGALTRPGSANHAGNHAAEYVGLPVFDAALCSPQNVCAPNEAQVAGET